MNSVNSRSTLRSLVAAIVTFSIIASSQGLLANTILVDDFETPSPGGNLGTGFQVSTALGPGTISIFRSTNNNANGEVNGTYSGALSWSMNYWGPSIAVAWGITSLNTLALPLDLDLTNPAATFDYDVQLHSGFSSGRASLEVRDGSGNSKTLTFGQSVTGTSDFDNTNTALPNGATYSIPLSVYASHVDLTDVAGLLFNPTAGGWQSPPGGFPGPNEVGVISEIRLTNVGAVPEPSSLLLAVVGLAALAGVARIRRKDSN